MTYNVKISDTGKSVIPENIDDLIFKSVPTVSIRKRISLNVTSKAIVSTYNYKDGQEQNTYTHNFGYIPQVIAFVTTSNLGDNHPNSYINVPQTWMDSYVETYWLYEEFRCYATSSIVVCKAVPYIAITEEPTYQTFAYTYTFNILILMEEALIS